ncbi:conserved unknown protein [Ectocarpus siliculosus]|uniref:Protein phosphatase n=1 Tax=Ectocarpus siliculosus TaxID=2880 RepID=D8LCX2_ECTSI|nr:conserved unknown protein [Ectocarpus siliculosus]|eukprot:CBN75514.1 conserved unknown protein [Ectocarpus siliculosus]
MTRRWLESFHAEDILRDKTLLRQQLEVRGDCTVDEAITAFVNQKVTSFVVVNRRKEVIGMFTSRDLLGELARYPNKADALKTRAHEFMIPLSRMIYASAKDSLYQCLLVMSELKVRNLPVIAEGKVMGIVNVNDISDFSFSMEELGGKKAYMKNISQRKGLPKGVGLDPGQNRSGWKQTFSASVGAVALPHPHKMTDGGVSANKREHRHLEVADDPTLSEDAYFVLDVAWPTETTDTVNYVGLADGVGSWRRVGVDPREFSHRLMHWAREYIVSMSPGSGIGGEGVMSPPPPKPHEVLMAAWEYTIGEKVVGSSTACVAALDYDLEQLSFSNIGDCGVVVLRHIDSNVAGYMREKKTPRHLRDSDLRLAFISQQQLRSFNLPYQFGYTNVPEDNANFETPRDAVNTSFPVRPGDIIILATDGLFDNMELENISSVALEWETKWFGGPMGGLNEHNNAALEDLAETLGHRARELSLDNTRDSPFALLAKENDIMWGGGMPYYITVVALRVINKADSTSEAVSTRGVAKHVQTVHEAAAA